MLQFINMDDKIHSICLDRFIIICNAFNLSSEGIGLLSKTIEFSLISFVEIGAIQ